MISVDCRIGMWDKGLSIQMPHGEKEALVALLGERLDVHYDVATRRLTVSSGSHGLWRTSPNRDADDEHRVIFRDFWPDGLPRFGLMPIRLEEDGPLTTSVRLPPIHELPYPRLYQCEGYDAGQVALACALARRRSAMQAGLKRMPAIPDHILSILNRRGLTRALYDGSVALQKELAA